MINNTGNITAVSSDAIRINTANSSIAITNNGTISVSAGGEAIDLNAITTASNTITNQSGGSSAPSAPMRSAPDKMAS